MKKTKLSSILIIILICTFALASSGCIRLEVLAQQVSETVVKTDGEDDYSIKYTVLLRNKGTAGKVRAKAKLYTPEGQFYREKIVNFDSDDETEIEFIFTEPTFLGALFGEGKTRAEFSYETVK
jgi:metal-sulfur cluster biosynthetic enzyme